MLKKLLVAIDGTEYSWRALEYAIGIAKMAESELGGLMGALGIGLPDVPIFLGAVFKTLFEISLRFGYPYDTQPEQIYQMLLICAAVGSRVRSGRQGMARSRS